MRSIEITPFNVVARRYRRRLRSKQKRKLRDQIRSGFIPTNRNTARIRIVAPQKISVYTDAVAKKTVRFLEMLRRAARGRVKVLIDFSRTELCTAAGTLLFLAEVDRINIHIDGLIVDT